MFTAGIDGKGLCFLMTDTQIISESFIEDINNLLNTGEIPNLTLHYFELVHDSKGKFKFRSYNVFYMFEDFW